VFRAIRRVRAQWLLSSRRPEADRCRATRPSRSALDVMLSYLEVWKEVGKYGLLMPGVLI
jgi:hypothetical protein